MAAANAADPEGSCAAPETCRDRDTYIYIYI